MERESFVFYASFLEAINEIPNANQLKVYQAIANFAIKGIEPTDLKGIEKAVFILIKPQIEANNKRYANGCKGAIYGAMGGRPKTPNETKQETPKKPQQNPELLPVQTPNDNENDNENVNENDNVNVSIVKRERFQKPTIEEIRKYSNEIGANIDAEKFYYHYESNGWMVGKNKMKDWQATVRTWKKSKYNENNKQSVANEFLELGREE